MVDDGPLPPACMKCEQVTGKTTCFPGPCVFFHERNIEGTKASQIATLDRIRRGARDAVRASELTDGERRTLTDAQRLLWRSDVESVCPSPDMCFEYSDIVRCGPCATKQSANHGVQINDGLANLPEVYRLNREVSRLREALSAIQQYGLDTLSGRTDGPSDVNWHRGAVNEMTKRARLAQEPQS